MNIRHPLVFIYNFQESTAYKTLQLSRAREFLLNYCNWRNSSVPITMEGSEINCYILFLWPIVIAHWYLHAS